MSKKLNDKQRQFAKEYIVDLNATQAAIRAGYSKKTARIQGCKLLTHPNIAEFIQKLKEKRAAKLEITQDRVLQEMARVAFSDLRKTLTENGHLKNPDEWDDDTAAAISSMEVVRNSRSGEDEDGNPEIEFTHKIKVYDKNSALEKLGRHLGMFNDKLDLTGDLNINVIDNFAEPDDTE